jgi:hypothetical protein
MMKSEDTPIQNINTQNNSGNTPELNDIKHDIPTFDLAEQILAAQRKIASFKRTAPSKTRNRDSIRNSNEEPKANPIPVPIPIPAPIPIKDDSEDKIISEIVARDILNFRSGRIAK